MESKYIYTPAKLAEPLVSVSDINVEDMKHYCPGGFYPISIGNCFAEGRYRILHKLGYGGSSTVWLARDQHQTKPGRLVALKSLCAEESSASRNFELEVHKVIQVANPPIPYIQTVEDHFFVNGPNGTHLFLIYPLAGPNLYVMCYAQYKRLRTDLARKVIKQLVCAVEGLHRAGVVHGDITTNNILFALQPHVLKWTDEQVYSILGKPVAYDVSTRNGAPLPADVPAQLIEPLDYTRLMFPAFLQEKIILADFGHSYPNTVQDYQPGTQVHYIAPEVHFGGRAGFEADVWVLACAIFQICAGYDIFYSYDCLAEDILKQNVAMIGRFPEHWWEQYKERSIYFLEDGEPKSVEEQEDAGVKPEDAVTKSSIHRELRLIGTDEDSLEDVGAMYENDGVMLLEEEVGLLGDLLERMLRLHPGNRLAMSEVSIHPWLESKDR